MPGAEKLNPSSSSKSHLKGGVAWQEALEAHPLVEESVVQSPRILRSLSSLGTGESSSPSHRGREWPGFPQRNAALRSLWHLRCRGGLTLVRSRGHYRDYRPGGHGLDGFHDHPAGLPSATLSLALLWNQSERVFPPGRAASEDTPEAALWFPHVQLEAPLFHFEAPQVQYTKLDQLDLHSLADMPTFAAVKKK